MVRRRLQASREEKLPPLVKTVSRVPRAFLEQKVPRLVTMVSQVPQAFLEEELSPLVPIMGFLVLKAAREQKLGLWEVLALLIPLAELMLLLVFMTFLFSRTTIKTTARVCTVIELIWISMDSKMALS